MQKFDVEFLYNLMDFNIDLTQNPVETILAYDGQENILTGQVGPYYFAFILNNKNTEGSPDWETVELETVAAKRAAYRIREAFFPNRIDSIVYIEDWLNKKYA